jgi:gamma-glutamylcyclotransferase (GGCT)/AIG2-like uncharacterized protein YtfP
MVKKIKIISGGQTGVDRAALDLARMLGLPRGGWCPKGRRAEDGSIGKGYRLKETRSADYTGRTLWNVRDSDATVILSLEEELCGGTAATRATAIDRGRPFLHLHPGSENPTVELRAFLKRHQVRVLNVAGPRASKEGAVGHFAWEVLAGALGAPARLREPVLFVYGTLREAVGIPMQKVIRRHAKRLGAATMKGRLYLVSDYPGAIEGGRRTVKGEIYRMNRPGVLLAELDAYELCLPGDPKRSEYDRAIVPVTFRGRIWPAWVYLYRRPIQGLRLIQGGDFLEFLRLERDHKLIRGFR